MSLKQKRDHSKFLEVTLITGSTVQATTEETWVRAAKIRGLKAVSSSGAPTANGASVYIGFKGLGDGNPSLTTEVGAGSTVSLDVYAGMTRDLSELWCRGSTGDKIHIEYTPA